ncbi:MAG: BACON domain-containing protein, partial [Bacteroidales bacterium]|nr:BACON domain-containing protein [Bacteroidales bacterium]
MKRLLYFLLALFLSVGCDKKDPEYPNQDQFPEDQGTIIMSSGTNLTNEIGIKGDSVVISFTASVPWTAQISNMTGSWCSIEPTSGVAGASTITISINENTDLERRSASVIIKAGGGSQKITISQACLSLSDILAVERAALIEFYNS